MNRAAPGVRGFNQVFGTYKHVAKKRGLEFALSKDEMRQLVTSNCFYCASPPSRISMAHYKGTLEASKFKYNGLDRKDNALGYTLDNVVACCYTCNRAKSNSPFEDFVKWLNKIALRWYNG